MNTSIEGNHFDSFSKSYILPIIQNVEQSTKTNPRTFPQLPYSDERLPYIKILLPAKLIRPIQNYSELIKSDQGSIMLC